MINSPPVELVKARVHIFTAFDIGAEIKMAAIPEIFRDRLSDLHRHEPWIKTPAREGHPIRVRLDDTSIRVGLHQFLCQVYATFFDIGSISIEFTTPNPLPLEGYPEFTSQILASGEIPRNAASIVERIFVSVKEAIVNPEISFITSTFVVHAIESLVPKVLANEIPEQVGTLVAQTLRTSTEAIGRTEMLRTLSPQITYSDNDSVFASSNVAIVFDETASVVADIFEFVNVQSLQLRIIDSRLDRSLNALYEDNGARSSMFRRVGGLFEPQSDKLNTLHLDSNIIMERVDQSFKFSPDSYLVQVHELASQKMYLSSLIQGISRKLVVIRDIVTDLRDKATSTRMEILEWIIIVLIAVEMIPVFYKK